MKIVVIGDGKVGRTIVEHTSREGHEVIIIDKNPKVIEQIVDKYDVMGICGNGASYEIQKSASVNKADLVVATTSSDEVNILSCIVAKALGARFTIARVRSYEYNSQIDIMKKTLGITLILNPEYETAKEISNIINFPEAIRVDTFAKGNVDLVELYIPENSPLIDQSLSSIHSKYQVSILVCAVQRGNEVIIPDGNFVFKAKDKIHITASRNNVRAFLKKLGLIESKLQTVLIIGGGKISLYLAEQLIKNKYKVKIVEKDYKRCLELSELLSDATIIHGDGSDQILLQEEGINETDAVVCLTDLDEENIIVSMYASKQNVHKIITKVNKSTLFNLFETIDMASIVAPKEITASRIVSYVRATSNLRGSNVITLYKLVNNQVEALEFIAKDNKKIVNIALKDLKLKSKILIACIIRDGEVIIPSGNDMIMNNDSVIVVTTADKCLTELSDILV
ncbi:MAG: Trk system potassium transporter TrkA [Bacilli bacterium]|nr:Trk system potassium transporter TrkA [Acholeplasmataceae bacterium]MDY2903196.1 Trk system potassium transporter TrkA [Bacilli bacterium]